MTLSESWRNVGNRIRYLRKANHLTLKQLSRGCDLSTNTISLVERGEVAPSIETLCKIATALGVSPGSLFLEVCTPQVDLQRTLDTEHHKETAEAVWQPSTCHPPSSASLQPRRQTTNSTDPIREGANYGRTSVFCLCGRLDLEVDGQSYCLKPGDNLTLNSSTFYRLQNAEAGTSIALLVFASNSLP